jgi:hypothetical protein
MPSVSIYSPPSFLRVLHELPDWLAAGHALTVSGRGDRRTFLVARPRLRVLVRPSPGPILLVRNVGGAVA